MLLRNPGELEVYWVRRHPETSFLSGYHAFPGGGVDPDDPGDTLEAQSRAAAVRETFEETGYRCTTPLIWVAQSHTPAYLGRRYVTRYYLAWTADTDRTAPAVNPADGELDEGAWIRPADALARWQAGEILLAPPTMAALRALAAGQLSEPWQDPAFSGPSRSPVRPHIDLVPLRSHTLYPATHTNCSVLGDDVLAIVDPASPFPDEQARIDAYLDGRIAAGARLDAIVLTHHHPDHIADVHRLAQRYGARVLAHPLTAERVPFPVDAPLDEGDVLQLGAEAYDILHTPGHAPGHIVLCHRGTGTFIVGDMVAGLGTILIEPGDGHMAQYLTSLARLRTLEPTALIPAHGPVIGGADAVLARYIRHRLAREAKIIAALNVGPGTIKALVERAYADAPPVVRMGSNGGIAGLSLRAHLEKLLDEGRARELAPGIFGP
jgi:glyoxylase-like metal-dependent hydrolase (beta-lactamase superfamily II)/8-oxo-dGTP pyrophosphatase MutT (NUDIX family)